MAEEKVVRLVPHNATPVQKITYRNPVVFVTALALQKMNLIIQKNSKEVGWLGSVRIADGDLYVDDVFLFEQQVHSATCEISAADLAKFGEKLLEQENGVEIWNSIRLWGHSHVYMAVNPSGQDDDQMKLFKDSPWFLRCIANKNGAMKFTFYDFAHGIVIDDVQWSLCYPAPSAELIAQIDAEVKEKVKDFTYPTRTAGATTGIQTHTGGRGQTAMVTKNSKLTWWDDGFCTDGGARIEGKWYTWAEIDRLFDADYVQDYIAIRNICSSVKTQGEKPKQEKTATDDDALMVEQRNMLGFNGFAYEKAVRYPMISLMSPTTIEHYFTADNFAILAETETLTRVADLAEFYIEYKTGCAVHIGEISAEKLRDYAREFIKTKAQAEKIVAAAQDEEKEKVN